MPKFEKEELHGPIRQNTNNNRNINHNQEKEDLKKYETIYKKIKK